MCAIKFSSTCEYVKCWEEHWWFPWLSSKQGWMGKTFGMTEATLNSYQLTPSVNNNEEIWWRLGLLTSRELVFRFSSICSRGALFLPERFIIDTIAVTCLGPGRDGMRAFKLTDTWLQWMTLQYIALISRKFYLTPSPVPALGRLFLVDAGV